MTVQSTGSTDPDKLSPQEAEEVIEAIREAEREEAEQQEPDQ